MNAILLSHLTSLVQQKWDQMNRQVELRHIGEHTGEPSTIEREEPGQKIDLTILSWVKYLTSKRHASYEMKNILLNIYSCESLEITYLDAVVIDNIIITLNHDEQLTHISSWQIVENTSSNSFHSS